MGEAAQQQPFVYQRRRDWTLWIVLAFVLVSVTAHLLLFDRLHAYAQAHPRAAPANTPIEMEMVELPPPPPPPPPKAEEPPPPKPRPVPRVKPPPVKVAEPVKPPPTPVDAPPPPNEEAAKAPPKPVPLVTGISMSSTSSAGSFAAPVGNTAYGKIDGKAQDPSQVQAYKAPKYVPSYQLDTQPVLAGEVKIPYPPEARRAEVEGDVVLSVRIDATGAVTSVKVLKGPGYGLNEAAADAIRRTRWKPALKNGQPVETQITYNYRFLLD